MNSISSPSAPHTVDEAEQLTSFFAPRGILLVGASRAPGKLGTAMTDALSAGPAPLALVNSKGGEGMYATVDEAAAALTDRGGTADLVVSCVPASATAAVIAAAGGVGVSAALVCAGGFAEVAGLGADYQEALQRAALATDVRVLGPNTSGFFVPRRALHASFVPGVADLAAGSIAVIASSGGVNHMTCFRLARSGVGISLGVGIGGGLGVNHADVLRYAAADPETTAIALHLETVADGEELLAAVRDVAALKPVVAYVVGRREDSAFAQSHTGALATSWRTTRSLVSQAGAVVVDDEDQLIASVTALSRVRLQPAADPGVALITAQAGPGLIIDDHAVARGWHMPRLSESTRATVSSLLSPLTFQENPVDTGRPGPDFDRIVHAVARDENVDLVAVYALTEPVIDLPGAITAASPDTPVLLCVDGPTRDIQVATDRAAEGRLALVTGPATLADAIDAVVTDARNQALAGDVIPPPLGHTVDVGGLWDEVRAKDLLDRLGIATPPRRRVPDAASAVSAFEELSGPVAVKMVDAAVLHKSDVGGVHLGVRSAEQVQDAVAAIAAVGASEFLIEQMAPDGVDLVVSVRRDPVFGPIALVGLGGVAAEAMEDVSIRATGFGRATVESMLDELRAGALLRGWRGGPSIDAAELAVILSSLAGALASSSHIDEIEINPLRLTGRGLVALDALVIASS